MIDASENTNQNDLKEENNVQNYTVDNSPIDSGGDVQIGDNTVNSNNTSNSHNTHIEGGFQDGDNFVTTKVNSIEKNLNIGENFGEIHIQTVTVDKEKKKNTEYSKQDISIEFPIKPPIDIPTIAISNLSNQAYQHLINKKILLLTCADQAIALAATHTLIQTIKQKENDKIDYRLIRGKKSVQENYDVFRLASEKIRKGKDLVIAVEVGNDTFFESLLSLSQTDANALFDQLERKNIRVICFISTFDQIEEWQRKPKKYNYAQWNIDFLEPLLQYHFQEDLTPLVESINWQRKQGLWGKNDREFYHTIDNYLNIGLIRLKQEIEKRKKYDGNNLEDFIEHQIENVKPALIIKKGFVHRYIAFVTAFFPELSLAEFRKIIQLLLADKKKKQIVLNKENKKEYDEIVFLDIWQEEGDSLLDECYVITTKDKFGAEHLIFSEPYLEEDFKEYFDTKERIYLQQQFDRILNSKFFFNPSLSEKLIQNLIALSVRMAIKDSQNNGLIPLINIAWNIEISNPESSDYNELNKIIKPYHISRLVSLLVEMLRHERLKDLIDDLLNAFIHIRLHSIVYQLMERLQFSDNFDKFFWLKRIFNNGNNDARKKAYHYLKNYAHKYPADLNTVLDTLIEWHPEKEREPIHYSPSHCFALSFIIDYILTINYSEHGKWPSPYPLFSGKNTVTNKEKQLIEWIFHPHMDFAYHKIEQLFDLENVHIHKWQVEILIHWFEVLYGFHKKQTNQEAKIFFEELLVEVIITINRHFKIRAKRLLVTTLEVELDNINQGLDGIDEVLEAISRIVIQEELNVNEEQMEANQKIKSKMEQYEKLAIRRYKTVKGLQKQIKKKIKELKKKIIS